jgi:PAS domain S-box-containing protein
MSKSTFASLKLLDSIGVAETKLPLAKVFLQVLMGVVCAILGLALTLLTRVIMPDAKFMFFLFGVVLASWNGGMLGGLVSSMLAAIFVDYFFAYYQYEDTAFHDVFMLIQIALFFCVAVLVSWMQSRRLHYVRLNRVLVAQREVILQSVADGITAQDANGKVVFANSAAATLLGFSDTQAMLAPAETLQPLYTMLDADGTVLPFELLPRFKVFREGVPAERVIRLKVNGQTDERRLEIRSAPVFDEKGKVLLSVNMLRDTTRERESERELVELGNHLLNQTQRLNNLINNIPGIIWEGTAQKDGTQKIGFVNDYAERVLGYAPEEWRATPDFWEKVIHPDDMEYARQRVDEIFSTIKAGTIQLRFVAKDGRVVHVETHTSYEMQPNQASAVYGVIMDITERKQYEQALSEYAANLRRSNEELEQFAYIASHDLQEPLRMMISYLQLIEQRYADKLDEDGLEFIRFAVDGSTRLKTLINDLLMYSRMQTKRADFKPVALGSVIERVLEDLQLSIEDTNATITCDALPTVSGDEAQLTQLFQNLISNGLKFHRDEPPSVHIAVQRLRRHWEISVRDNGIGIEPQYLDRIFVIFQRLHTKDKYPGTGIGLAICKKVVENHGGRIWVESAPGKGASFYFTLPLNNGAGAEDDTNHGINH